MFIKLIITILIIINLNVPFNSIIDIGLLGILFAFLISTKINQSTKEIILTNKIRFLLILSMTAINIFLPKLSIEEAHSIFLNSNDINTIGEFLPTQIITEIKNDYQNFDTKRMFKSSNSTQFNSLEKFSKFNSIKSPFAFSSDSFFQKKKYSRKVNNINFSTRENLRISQFNTLNYSLPFDKHFRRILPYYVFYEIPEIAKGSSICSKGNLFFYLSKNEFDFNKDKEISFRRNPDEKCFQYDSKYKKLYLIGYSINEKDNLSINLKKNIYLIIIDFIKYFVTFLIILFAFSFSKIIIKNNLFIYFISFFSTIILALIRDPNLISGLRYFRGGADGILHYSRGLDITQNLIKGEYLLFLRGGNDVFYFMPGLRYFSSLSNIFFGDTNFGYILLATFLPYAIFKLFKIYTNTKVAFILLISFIFFPIFENMGFGHFNYIWQIARNHAETLSITLIVIGLTFIVNIEKNKKIDIIKILFSIILFSFAVLARPNFFPTTTIFTLYVILILYLNKNYNYIFLVSFFYCISFLCLMHNIYFGNSFVLFTHANLHFAFTERFYELILDDGINIIIRQLIIWNPLYNIHRLIILIIILYSIINYRHNFFTYALFLSVITQHLVLLTTHPGGRYAYLAWFLTFILFVKVEYSNKVLQQLFIKTKKLLI
jgi:hypothetical protein